VRSLAFALENKLPIVLLHKADAGNCGCTFGTIIGQCPSELMQIRGHGGAKLFDAIAVQFSRGPHQPVSTRLLAMSLGAKAAQRQWLKSPMPCLRQMCRSMARPVKKPVNSTELIRTRHSGAATAAEDDPTREMGWSVFDEESGAASANEQNPGALRRATLNPMFPRADQRTGGGRGGADAGFRSAAPLPVDLGRPSN
jgi:hypothetical protein